jgi:hypothetical protein
MYVDEKYIKLLEDRRNEYFEERNRLVKIKERYTKKGKDVPKNLDKRIRKCNVLFDYYDGLIKQSIEAKFNMARQRQEAELRKSLNVRDGSMIIYEFNPYYGMSPFIR